MHDPKCLRSNSFIVCIDVPLCQCCTVNSGGSRSAQGFLMNERPGAERATTICGPAPNRTRREALKSLITGAGSNSKGLQAIRIRAGDVEKLRSK